MRLLLLAYAVAWAPPRRRIRPPSLRRHAAPADPKTGSGCATWDAKYADLVAYKEEWGTADAVLGDELGRWCARQRRLRDEGNLAADRVALLDALGFPWASSTAVEDVTELWDLRIRALAAYKAKYGHGQVQKKWREDPGLGGWVAAVRRKGPNAYTPEQRAELEAAGFEWTSLRSCGSAFMKGFRAFRDFRAERPDAELPADVAKWAKATRAAAAKGLLSRERLDYLDSVDFFVAYELRKVD